MAKRNIVDNVYSNAKMEGINVTKVPDNKLEEFNVLLSDFYSTNNKEKIKQFIYDYCIEGITF